MNESSRSILVKRYLDEVSEQFYSGHAIEHAYRPALKLLMSSFEDTVAVNDPKHSEHGAPDFIFLKKSNNKIIKGYAEAKDITVSLDKTEKTDQMQRYHGYTNLFLTDYLEFRFFRNGEKYETISLGSVKNGVLHTTPENGERLARELEAFLQQAPEKIRSGKRLAQIMGGKARRIRDNVSQYLNDNEINSEEFDKIYGMMKKMLVHDLEPEKFADMYAQTLVYGLFVARYSDKTPESFDRSEARDLVPKSNPFLRHFFDHIVGPNFDTRLSYIVDELCEIFSVSNVAEIVHKHLRIQDDTQETKDPIIHFYEDFLQEYDPLERKKMGAYYTPIPVVKYIVRQVDQILKEDFGLAKGLASTETVQYQIDSGQDMRHDKRKKLNTMQTLTVPRVQVLDPAVGTATFLNETIKFIYEGFKGQEGRWPSYVNDSLLKRLHGFELMMAPYTIAHLKLGMTLKETGVENLADRLGVYLTNTLEEGIPTQQDLFSFGFAEAVSEESRLAAEVKSERPVMIVMGNPPYSGVSSNETKYANNLITKYKVEPGGNQKLQERKHWLNNDYVKFIAFAEDLVLKNGNGVIAMITDNSYLYGATFRGMRWHLAKTFDKIYVLDLHGNSKKNETADDGSKDENVFDITQGVSIILAVKVGGNESKMADVYHADLRGRRRTKFDALLGDIDFAHVSQTDKNFSFIPQNSRGQDDYESGVQVDLLFQQNVTGIVTMGDGFIVADNPQTIANRVQKLAANEYDESTLNAKFGLGKNYAKFVLDGASKLRFDSDKIIKLNYRPFDERYTYFDNKVVWRWREKVMRNYLNHENIGLTLTRNLEQQREWADVLVSEGMITHHSLSIKEVNYSLPLYIYHDDGTRTANFAQDYLAELMRNTSLQPEPEDVLDYVYATLYSPSYREKYKEFLKNDFPRVPVPVDDSDFRRLAAHGRELRELHLMKAYILDNYQTSFPIAGGNIVEKIEYSDNRVWINDTQFFGNVPQQAWGFYIGGYQPAQKWLKDRKGSPLSDSELNQYQKIITVLLETNRLMQKIDNSLLN